MTGRVAPDASGADDCIGSQFTGTGVTSWYRGDRVTFVADLSAPRT